MQNTGISEKYIDILRRWAALSQSSKKELVVLRGNRNSCMVPIVPTKTYLQSRLVAAVTKRDSAKVRCLLGATDHCPKGYVGIKVKLDVNEYRSEGGKSLLHIAAANDSLAIAKVLLSFCADINARDKSRQTSLHYAVSHKHMRMARLLLGNGANPNLRDKEGYSALHYAVTGDIRPVKLLLSNDAQVDARNKYDETPLREAVRPMLLSLSSRDGRYSVVRLLLDSGASYQRRVGGVNSHTRDMTIYELVMASKDQLLKELFREHLSRRRGRRV